MVELGQTELYGEYSSKSVVRKRIHLSKIKANDFHQFEPVQVAKFQSFIVELRYLMLKNKITPDSAG